MRTILSVLTSSGDQELSWDPANPAEVAEARVMVAALKASGYSFFLADGTMAPDEVSAGNGALKVRRVSAEELLAAVEPEEPFEPEEEPAPALVEVPAPRGRRGRRGAYGQKAVAVPPMAGG